MAAERQIEANRPNAEESTGPKARVPAPSRRHALRLLTMALPAACCAYCQCTLWNQSTCSSVYSGGNPTLGQYLSNEWSSYNQVNAANAAKPQPKIPILTGQIAPANGSYLTTIGQVAALAPYITTYMAWMKGIGITTQDWFGQTTAMAASVQCNPSNYNCPVPSDCVGGVYLALNQALPAGANGPLCTALYYYDKMFAYAAANGITIRGGFPEDTAQVTACGLTPGSITKAQFIACIGPPTQAEFARYGSAITRYQAMIEPVAGAAGIEQFSVSDFGAIVVYISGVIRAISPSTKIGAAYTGMSWPTSAAPNSDLCYWLDATGVANPSLVNSACTTSPTGVSAAVDYVNIDVFGGTCDQSGNAYATELLWFQDNFLSAAANPNNLPVFVGQADPPRWCSVSLRPTEQNAYLGCLDMVWDTSGLRPVWQQTFVGWASANNIGSVSLYFTIPWFGGTSNQSNDNCVLGNAVANAMTTLSPNANAANWEQLKNWWTESLQGSSSLTGSAHLGH
jgi:hypothetical protein